MDLGYFGVKSPFRAQRTFYVRLAYGNWFALNYPQGQRPLGGC